MASSKITFKNVSGQTRALGRPDGLTVKAGDVIAFDAELVEELPDAYVVEEAGQARAWPKETWELVGGKKPAAGSAQQKKGADS